VQNKRNKKEFLEVCELSSFLKKVFMGSWAKKFGLWAAGCKCLMYGL
jgi:hypothetical protein